MLLDSKKKINKKWSTKDIPDLTNKTALITGANSGLGYCTAKALAEKGCRVILACRTLEKSNQAKYKLNKLFPIIKNI